MSVTNNLNDVTVTVKKNVYKYMTLIIFIQLFSAFVMSVDQRALFKKTKHN